MKIDPQLARQAQRIEPATTLEQSAWQLAWRRELERAQQLVAPTHGDSPAGGDAQARMPGRDMPPMPAAQSQGQSAQRSLGPRSDAPVHQPLAEPHGVPASTQPVASLPHGSGAGDGRQTAPWLQRAVAGQASTAERVGYLEALRANSAAALAARLERLAWLPRAAHVSVSEKGVEVSLRDPELSEDDAAHLLERVRREVREAGFELASLVVNGRAIGA